MKRSLNGDVSLNGDNLTLSGIDIDALIPKYERSQNFNLVDVGAYFLVGPFGPVLTKSYNFGSLYEESQGGKGNISKLVSIWKVKNGIAGATDVALATKKYRIAMKGGLNFNNDQFDDVTVAVLDKRGCAVYSQKVHGPFRKAEDREGKHLKVNYGIRVERAEGCMEIHWWRVQGILLRFGGSARGISIIHDNAVSSRRCGYAIFYISEHSLC